MEIVLVWKLPFSIQFTIQQHKTNTERGERARAPIFIIIIFFSRSLSIPFYSSISWAKSKSILDDGISICSVFSIWVFPLSMPISAVHSATNKKKKHRRINKPKQIARIKLPDISWSGHSNYALYGMLFTFQSTKNAEIPT